MDVSSFTYPASVVRRHPPLNLLPGDENCFIHELVRLFPAVEALEARDVVVSGDGLCLVGGRFPPFAALCHPGSAVPLRQVVKTRLLVARRMLQTIPETRCRHIEKGMLLTDAFFDGFFHWFGDILPKLQALKNCGADLDGRTILIPASRYASYVADSLAAYDITCQVIPHDAAVRVAHLCFIPRLAPTGNFRSELMLSVRDVMRQRFASQEEGVRLYVSRRAAPKRHLLNEDSLETILARHGFMGVCMEQLSFVEQVGLASRCDVLVGLHGAGLTHMLWTSPKTTVLEIRGAGDRHNNCYYSLASDLGHDYYYVTAERRSRLRPSFLADFVVNVDRFEATLVQALGGKS